MRRLTDQHGEDVEELGPFLLMCADFDAAVESWTAELCGRAGGQLDSVMSFCDGWPGSGEPGAVAEFFMRHNAAPGFTVAGYRRATVEEVREKLALRSSLRELAVRAANGGLEGTALRRAWREAVGP